MDEDLLHSLRYIAHREVEFHPFYSVEDVMSNGHAIAVAFRRKFGHGQTIHWDLHIIIEHEHINGWEVRVVSKDDLIISRERKVIQFVFRSQYTIGGDYDQVYFTIDGEEFAVEDFIFPLLEDESYLDRYYSEDYCSVTVPQTPSPKT